MKNILFIGLGRMGFPMAGHLAQSGQYAVYVDNRSPQKVANWCEQYIGKPHDSNVRYDVVVLCVGNDEDVVNTLAIGGEVFSCLSENAVIIDHTTTSATLATSQAQQLIKYGIHYIDAPVSGGEAGAINGTLSAMLGGDSDAVDGCMDLLSHYCVSIVHLGDSGAGQIAKMANQLCIAGVLQGLSEAILLIEKSGIASDKVYQAIKGGAAQSWQLDNRYSTMIRGEYDFGFAVKHMIKDLNYAINTAKQQQWTPENACNTVEHYLALVDKGYADNDTSVLLEYWRGGR